MRCAYSLMLDVTDRQVVIVGGGAVAARKAAGVIAAGATRVRVVSLEFVKTMPQNVERVASKYSSQHLDGAELVFAATNDPATNEQVVRDARARKILVSRADSDDDEPGDFLTPALFRDGRVTVTVSAGSPALSVHIRDCLAKCWQGGWPKMADAMHALRPEIRKDNRIPIERRKAIFNDLATQDAIDILDAGGITALRKWLAQRHPEAFAHAAS